VRYGDTVEPTQRIEAESGMNELQVGQLAQDLENGYMAHAATTALLRHPYALGALEGLERENEGPAVVPIVPVRRRDGTAHFFDLSHFVRLVSMKPDFQSEQDRLWMTAALLTLGDELAQVGYFDQGPDLEFIRHLRNGVGHGNRFHFLHGEPRRPAHFTGAAGGDGSTPLVYPATTFEITSTLEGQSVLFDYLGPGDVCDLFLLVANRLIRIGNGDPPLALWPQRL
jgi:hypothetical protein